jgi:hypothetical protein
MSPRWLWNRLRAMGPAEIIYRVRQKAAVVLERSGVGLVRAIPARGASGKPWAASPSKVNPAIYVAAADRILRGEYDVFAFRGAPLGFPPQWNRCPKTGTLAPLSFGKTLNYRDEKLVGDIKYLWEPSRHLELVTLAQAWHLSRDGRYADAARRLVESWIEQCPYPLGAHWTSSLEHSVRLVNWAVAWHLLGGDDAPIFSGDDGAVFRERWLRSIRQHCHFIAGHFSRYSSANNHLLGELMGLFIGALTWPMWPESKRWREMAGRGLEAEALRQNASDGVNREQAFWYHHEVADMLLLCLLFARGNGMDFSGAFARRLETMLDFIAALIDVAGNVPMVGDSDDAVMVRFSREADFNAYRSLLATGGVLFDRSDLARKGAAFDDKSRWLLGDDAEACFSQLCSERGGAQYPHAFPEGGYWVLGHALDEPDEIRIVADAGPLGYLSIAAHGHADALSFCLSIAGRPILVDPGTFAYHTQKEWRDYFRGTLAHNTVRIDGVDQSVIGGNFMWTAHAGAACHTFEPGGREDIWEASHEGYRRLADPVTHRRRLRLDKGSRVLQVEDTLECRGRHRVDVSWHFHPDCEVDIFEGEVRVRSGRVHVSLSMADRQLEPRLLRGSIQPIAGWYSDRFDEKRSTTTVVFSGDIEGMTCLATRMAFHISN